MTNRQKKIEELKRQAILKKTKREVYQVTPEIYAAFALCLDGRGWTFEQIEELFAETQKLWTDMLGDGDDMCKICEEVTGIVLAERKESDNPYQE